MFNLFSLSSLVCAPFTLPATVVSVGGSVLWSYIGSPLYSTAGYITKYAVSTGTSYIWRKATGSATRYAVAGATTYVTGRVLNRATNYMTGRTQPKLLNFGVEYDAQQNRNIPSTDSVLFASKNMENGMPQNKGCDMPLVYFIRSGCITKNEYKIGRTKGAVEKRLAQLQTGSVSKLYVEFVIYTTDAPALELCFHKKLGKRRIRSEGEWFSLNRTELNTIEHLVKRWSLQELETTEIKDYSVYKIVDTENFMLKIKDL